jgi:hypothetical protein
VSQPVELNQALDEGSRQAYLDALGVVQWIPTNHQSPHQTEELQTVKTENTGNQLVSSLNENSAQESYTQDSSEHASTKVIISETCSNESAQAISSEQVNPDNASATNSKTTDDDSQSSQPIESIQSDESSQIASMEPKDTFLKLVNWTNPVLNEENAETIMIVCRHQVDQPANSFARTNSPSQFMMDYINAMTQLGATHSIDYKVQLAHLSAAGLSQDCVPIDQAMQLNKPVLVLLLGDETVSHLLGEDKSVASARGQLHQLLGGQHVIASYHPFSLIKNPALKRLAFEDLALVRELVQHQRQHQHQQ